MGIRAVRMNGFRQPHSFLDNLGDEVVYRLYMKELSVTAHHRQLDNLFLILTYREDTVKLTVWKRLSRLAIV